MPSAGHPMAGEGEHAFQTVAITSFFLVPVPTDAVIELNKRRLARRIFAALSIGLILLLEFALTSCAAGTER
jgi:hypothetical protein